MKSSFLLNNRLSIAVLSGLLFVSTLGCNSPASDRTTTIYFELDMSVPLAEGWLDSGTETVGLRGDHAPLSWSSTTPASLKEEGIYHLSLPFSISADSITLSFKIKVDGTDNPDDGWQQGNNHLITLHPGSTDTVKLAFQDQPPTPEPTITGRVEHFEDFPSKELVSRDLFIYLPPNYEENSDQRYPVLYMHDGQLLFDASVRGQEWTMDEAAERLINDGVIEPLIIVGISNTENRMEEYTPTRQEWHFDLTRASPPTSNDKWRNITGAFEVETGETIRIKSENDSLFTQIPGSDFWQPVIAQSDSTLFIPQAGITLTFELGDGKPAQRVSADKPTMGGDGDLYGDFILNEVKPFVDANLRTRPEAEWTALGGSSLGGLITLYLGLEHPDTFGQLLVVSPSVWWDQQYILRKVQQLESSTGQPIWLYMGTAEGEEAVRNVELLHEALMQSGWQEDELELVIEPDAAHNELAWSKQAEAMLRFLFPVQD